MAGSWLDQGAFSSLLLLHVLTMSASAVSAVRLEGCSVVQGKNEDSNMFQAGYVMGGV
jgi:hypothetical protein